MVRNAVKFIFIRKMREKSRRRQTGIVVYFGLLLFKSEFGVSESEKRVAAIFLLPVWHLKPPGRTFLPYSACIVACRTSTARNAFYTKTGCTKLNLWPESTIQKPEVLSKVPEMV